MNFPVTAEEHARVTEWLSTTVYPALVTQQKADLAAGHQAPTEVHRSCWEAGYPYGGAIGGGLTYEFTPTSLGTVLIVRHVGFSETLNLTDYDSW